MKEIFLLSDSGSNYVFEGSSIVGLEKNRKVKYTSENGKLKKSIELYGGLRLALFDGKHLIAQNKTFYITE